jgi:hypothetical protein
MYEHHKQPLIDTKEFAKRMIQHGALSFFLVVVSLLIGMLGFHYFSDQLWIDALLNSAMLLGGMGPIGDMGPTSGKLFATVFALYAGLVFLIAAGIMSAPLFHRMLHKFHLSGK